jgi:hypothetical protein
VGCELYVPFFQQGAYLAAQEYSLPYALTLGEGIVDADDEPLSPSLSGHSHHDGRPRLATLRPAGVIQTAILDSGYEYCILSNESLYESGLVPQRCLSLLLELLHIILGEIGEALNVPLHSSFMLQLEVSH